MTHITPPGEGGPNWILYTSCDTSFRSVRLSGLVVNTPVYIREAPNLNLESEKAILSEMLHGFPWSLQGNTEIVS